MRQKMPQKKKLVNIRGGREKIAQDSPPTQTVPAEINGAKGAVFPA